jgi:hypothetical protein
VPKGTPMDTKKFIFDLVSPEPNSGCWLWTGGSNATGYGYCTGRAFGQKGMITVHRASWLSHRGAIPDGMCVCHKCDTRLCCNPDHLFLGTRADNIADMDMKGRRVTRCNPRRGAAHYAAKLTSEQVRLIKSASMGQKELSRLCGVNPSTISRIKTGKRRAAG